MYQTIPVVYANHYYDDEREGTIQWDGFMIVAAVGICISVWWYLSKVKHHSQGFASGVSIILAVLAAIFLPNTLLIGLGIGFFALWFYKCIISGEWNQNNR